MHKIFASGGKADFYPGFLWSSTLVKAKVAATTNSKACVWLTPQTTTNQYMDFHLCHVLHCSHIASAPNGHLPAFVYV